MPTTLFFIKQMGIVLSFLLLLACGDKGASNSLSSGISFDSKTNTIHKSSSSAGKICRDTNGDGRGTYDGSNKSCQGPKVLQNTLSDLVNKPHNRNARLSFNINLLSCNNNYQTFTKDLGCLERVYSGSPAFQQYAREVGISKAGAVAKFYPAGNTLHPLDRVMVIVSPYIPEGSPSIDLEFDRFARQSRGSGGKINNLFNYLFKEGISVLYVSYGHLANSSLPLEDKASALRKILKRLVQIRRSRKNSKRFWRSNIMGLSLGGVIAKRALRKMEEANESHEMNLYISMDSPHYGFHIPLGIQRLPTVVESVFNYAERKLGYNDFLDELLGDILNIRIDEIENGITSFGNAASAAGQINEEVKSSIPVQELLIRNTNANNQNMRSPEFQKTFDNAAKFPRKTVANVGIANGSTFGLKQNFPGLFFELVTSRRDNVNFSLFATPVGTTDHGIYSYAWIRFPDRNQLWQGRRYYERYYYTTNTNFYSDDFVPCSTTKSIIKNLETGLNESFSVQWPEKLQVSNYRTCFVPTGSALAVDGSGYIYDRDYIDKNRSNFDIVIGEDANSAHLFFSNKITNGIVNELKRYGAHGGRSSARSLASRKPHVVSKKPGQRKSHDFLSELARHDDPVKDRLRPNGSKKDREKKSSGGSQGGNSQAGKNFSADGLPWQITNESDKHCRHRSWTGINKSKLVRRPASVKNLRYNNNWCR